MKAISIKLPEPLFVDLAARAELTHTSTSHLVREALQHYLAAPARRQPASVAARMRRWVGVHDGPQDLSTNPAHLDGFGT